MLDGVTVSSSRPKEDFAVEGGDPSGVEVAPERAEEA